MERISSHACINIFQIIGTSLRLILNSPLTEVVDLTRRVDDCPIVLCDPCLSRPSRASLGSPPREPSAVKGNVMLLIRGLEEVKGNVLLPIRGRAWKSPLSSTPAVVLAVDFLDKLPIFCVDISD